MSIIATSTDKAIFSALRIIMTESYSKPEVIRKYYQSEDGSRDGAHLPFNFQMIDVVKRYSTADDIVKMVNHWFTVVPKGKVTNWVVSHYKIRILSIK